MDVIGVAEVAEELALSPRRVRQMLASGVLPGKHLGREWVIERRALDRARQHRGSVGRPWNPSSAWAVLAIASGDDPELSPVERSRAKHRFAERGLAGLVGRLRARAELRRFYGHPSVLGHLADEHAVVRSGVSAAADHGADIVASDVFEAYVPEQRLAGLVDRYGLDASAERPNVLLRAVDSTLWPFAPHAKVAPRPVVAVDLLEADDERSRRAGVEMARRRP